MFIVYATIQFYYINDNITLMEQMRHDHMNKTNCEYNNEDKKLLYCTSQKYILSQRQSTNNVFWH